MTPTHYMARVQLDEEELQGRSTITRARRCRRALCPLRKCRVRHRRLPDDVLVVMPQRRALMTSLMTMSRVMRIGVDVVKIHVRDGMELQLRVEEPSSEASDLPERSPVTPKPTRVSTHGG
jgi:hypothetical protein